MTDKRLEKLIAFVKSIISQDEIMLLPLNGDASFRRYFRVEGRELIAVDAPPKTQKNKEFIQIDKALEESGVKVPHIIAYDLEEGFMLLEDLGDITFDRVAVGDAMAGYYKKAVELLSRILPCDRKLRELPVFDRDFMLFEMSLFETWMLNSRLSVTLDENEKRILDEAYDYIITTIESIPYAAMHRDYHSRNLMLSSDELAVIDFQDMVKGPVTYDLASIVYDCYINLDKSLCDSLLSLGYDNFKALGYLWDNLSLDDFKKYVSITSLQRHIKVLGIFCRLSIRDGKDGYLKDLPRVINYVLDECDCDPHFSKLKGIVEKYVAGRF